MNALALAGTPQIVQDEPKHSSKTLQELLEEKRPQSADCYGLSSIVTRSQPHSTFIGELKTHKAKYSVTFQALWTTIKSCWNNESASFTQTCGVHSSPSESQKWKGAAKILKSQLKLLSKGIFMSSLGTFWPY